MTSQTASSKCVTESQRVAYWTQYLRSFMAPLFKAAGSYTEAEQLSHLKFLDEHIAPKLGPHAAEPHVPYSPPCSLVGSPLDPSYNFTGKSKPRVRFDFDVIAPLDRTGPDPYAEDVARKEIHQLASVVGADTKWMDYLMDTLYLSPAETEVVRVKMPSHVVAPPSSVGVDFDGPTKTMKMYIPGIRKSMATGEPENDVMLKVVRGLEPMGSELAPAMELVTEYLATAKYDIYFPLIGIDCLDPTKYKNARVKCYLHVHNLSFAAVRDAMTLGGRLDDEVSLQRVEVLRSLWPLLISEPKDADISDETWQKPARYPDTHYGVLQFTVEITPGKSIPETKIYVPTFQFTNRAKTAEKNFEEILKKLDHDWGHSGKYVEVMEDIFGQEGDYGQTFVSFSSTKEKGVSTTSYVAMPIKEVKSGLAGEIEIHQD